MWLGPLFGAAVITMSSIITLAYSNWASKLAFGRCEIINAMKIDRLSIITDPSVQTN